MTQTKPPDAASKLLELGTIRGIIIEYRQTGVDTAETYCEILGNGSKKVAGRWETYSPYLDVQVDWASVARVSKRYRDQYDAWVKFERENAKELAEYERLKTKFDPKVKP